MKRRFYSLRDYLIDTYGKKLYKISIDAGFTCPNRDGTKGYGGCKFCSEKGSGDFAGKGKIKSQIDEAKKNYSIKLKNIENAEYIAYFQAFTNTYAPIEKLKELYYEAINEEKIKVLSIATRADCISDEIIDLLSEIRKKIDVWIEIGLQTSNDETAKRINRCYETKIYDEIMPKLKNAGINVITHLILSLPKENHEDEIRSLEHIIALKTDGIKFHLLYKTKDSRLDDSEFIPLSKEEYTYRICDLIARCPERTVIHRLTGDGDKNTLIEPLWSLEKIEVLNGINKYLENHNIYQGNKYIP